MFCLDAREGHAAGTTSLREFYLCARGGMATPALPALGLNSLPSDVLMIILRLLPLVPRVRTISILNKRLRELVYRSIDALTDYPQDRMRYRAPHYYKALSRLTSLTALNLRVTPSWPTTYVLPASLRHLGLRSRRAITILEPRPALTSLALRVCGKHARDFIAPFVSSLRQLDIFCVRSETPSLASLHLPLLIDLAIGPENLSYVTFDFCVLHATQLETLTLLSSWKYISLLITCNVHFPRLRTLRLDAVVDSEIRTLILRCPQLTAIHHLTKPLLQARSLTTQSIAIHEWQPCFDDMQVTGDVAALASVTYLRSLTIRCPVPLPPLLNLSALRKLTIIINSTPEALSTLQHFLQYCPQLSKVVIVCAHIAAQQFTAIVRDLDRRGVAEFAYYCNERVRKKDRVVVPMDLHWLLVHKLAQTQDKDGRYGYES